MRQMNMNLYQFQCNIFFSQLFWSSEKKNGSKIISIQDETWKIKTWPKAAHINSFVEFCLVSHSRMNDNYFDSHLVEIILIRGKRKKTAVMCATNGNYLVN